MRYALAVLVLASCASQQKPPPPPAVAAKPSAPPEKATYATTISACDRGERDACQRLTERVLEGAVPAIAQAFGPALAKQCARGLIDACAGDALVKAQRPGSDFGAITAELKKACDAGSSAGCATWAEWQVSRQDSDDAAREQARKDAEAQCEKLGGSVCFSVASFYGEGQGAPKDEAKASSYISKACATGSAYGCYVEGMTAAEQGPDGEAKARGLYQKACDAQLPPACFNLGHQLMRGKGGAADPAKGLGYAQRACELGDGQACDYLALSNQGAHEEDPDHAYATPEQEEAALKRYCALGGGESCATLAFTRGKHAEESGALEEMDEVLRLLQLGCDAQSMRSCNALGHVGKDAISGCEGGDPGQCLVASFVHARGVKVPAGMGETIAPDPARAAAERKQACDGGMKAACE